MLTLRAPSTIDQYISPLFHALLGALGMAFLLFLLFSPAKDIYAEKALVPLTKSGDANATEKRNSANFDSGLFGDESQPYYIPSPDALPS